MGATVPILPENTAGGGGGTSPSLTQQGKEARKQKRQERSAGAQNAMSGLKAQTDKRVAETSEQYNRASADLSARASQMQSEVRPIQIPSLKRGATIRKDGIYVLHLHKGEHIVPARGKRGGKKAERSRR